MPKFSIIIPVYNTEKYLEKCLGSVFEQDFEDYEVIVVNDGSTDNSGMILKKYLDKIIYIDLKEKTTVGPSYARNAGIMKAKGNYILFLDSDDYYEKELLSTLNNYLINNYDMIRFQIQYDCEGIKKQLAFDHNNLEFLDGIEAFNNICSYSIIESPCCYAFSRRYLIDNNFKFKEDTLHEDYGLIPLMIIKAKKLKCLDYVGYNYVLHDNSIMTSNDCAKVIKKANDFLVHFKNLKMESSKISGDLSIFNSYISNSVILKSTTLKGKDYKNYVNELRKIGAFDMLLDDSIGRKVKKILVRISPKMYYKIVGR